MSGAFIALDFLSSKWHFVLKLCNQRARKTICKVIGKVKVNWKKVEKTVRLLSASGLRPLVRRED
jgi:hypothetical protein